jgi:hypothetical protein
MMKMNASIVFLLLVINFIFMPSLIASEELDVQYFFDDRYNYYSDSDRVSFRVNKRFFYKHSDIFRNALLVYRKSHQKIKYEDCDSNKYSHYIIKLEPNFFYNPLMKTMYAELKFNIYEEPSNQIKQGTLSIQKIQYLQVRQDIQLTNLYKEFIKQLSDIIPKPSSESKINGSFCSLL